MSQNKQVVRIHIEHQLYESPSPTTGSALYEIASVPLDLRLFKVERGLGEDFIVPNDTTSIELMNGEYFEIGKPEGVGTTIYVNTYSFVWTRPQIRYDELVKLAFPDGPFGGDVRYTITWTKPDGTEGAVLKDGKVKVVDEMKFDVRNTDKS